MMCTLEIWSRLHDSIHYPVFIFDEKAAVLSFYGIQAL